MTRWTTIMLTAGLTVGSLFADGKAAADYAWTTGDPPRGTISPNDAQVLLAPGKSKQFTAYEIGDNDCKKDTSTNELFTVADEVPTTKVRWGLDRSFGTLTPASGVGTSVTYTSPTTSGPWVRLTLYVDDLSANPPGAHDPEYPADFVDIYQVLPNGEDVEWQDHFSKAPHEIGDKFSPHTVYFKSFLGERQNVDFSGLVITEYQGFQFVSCSVPNLSVDEVMQGQEGWNGNWTINGSNQRSENDEHGFNRDALGGDWLGTGEVVINQRMKVTSPVVGSTWFVIHQLKFRFKNEGLPPNTEYNCYVSKHGVACPDF